MRTPIKKKIMLNCLNNEEVVEGYLDGLENAPEPHGNRTYSYWHGWRNGMVDGGFREKDDAQILLAHDYVHGD
tara:strand:+ start:286 stop:504 length:219 start_codon:yes stop_codon:yes gene_type:complete